MPSILGANTLSSGYDVANSCKFDGDGDSLSKEISGVNTTKLTISFWFKVCQIDGTYGNMLFSSENNSSDYLAIHQNTTGNLDIQITGTANRRITSAIFRDPSAWYHLVVAFDSTQGTASNRIKVYVNGTQVTSFGTSTDGMAEDSNLSPVDETLDYAVGTYQAQHANYSVNGYMAEVVALYGQALGPTSFGEFDSDSPQIWKPIDVSGLTFGGNSFYLDFEDSSALGADVSGNSNNFTVNNLTAVDQSLDTCTNNFCTMNPLTKTSATLSEGNLKQATAGNSAVATFGVSAGKWYFEQKLLGGNNEAHLGFALEEAGIFFDAVTGGTVRGAGYVSLYSFDGKIYNEGSATSSFGTFAANDIVGFALDVDNGNVYLYQNGSALNSGNAVVSGKTGKTWFPFGNFDAGDVTGIEHNFGGARTFTISSAVADANGFGAFEFSPGSYLALCTKNLGSDGG